MAVVICEHDVAQEECPYCKRVNAQAMTPPREVKRWVADKDMRGMMRSATASDSYSYTYVSLHDYDALSALVSQLRARLADAEERHAVTERGASALAESLELATQRAEAAERDAARYRWVRTHPENLMWLGIYNVSQWALPNLIDERVDASLPLATADATDEKKGEG